MYRYEATSVAGFVQQLAVGYVSRGYLLYVTGSIPERSDPRKTDRHIIEKYGINISKFTRFRRNTLGIAPIQYLRFGRFFVILVRPGRHRFLVEEGKIERIVNRPIKFAGYSIGYRKGRDGKFHASVRIEKIEFEFIKRRFLILALRTKPPALIAKLTRLGFAPYAPIRGQLRELLRAVNKKRERAGLCRVPDGTLPRERKIVKPFR